MESKYSLKSISLGCEHHDVSSVKDLSVLFLDEGRLEEERRRGGEEEEGKYEQEYYQTR